MSEDLHEKLGEIKGLLQGIDKKVDGLEDRMDRQDDRLRSVEKRSFLNTSVVASVVSVGIAIIKDRIGV